jgi:hypothetical protein
MSMIAYSRLFLAASLLLLPGCSTMTENGGSRQAIEVTIPYGSHDALRPYWPRPFTRHMSNNFYVLLTNVSGKPVRVWQEWCSWGYYSLQFEVFDRDGREHLLKKKPTGFLANFEDYVELQPGGSVVWKVDLEPSVWKGLSWVPTNGVERAKLRAVYTVKNEDDPRKYDYNDAKRYGVWTGRVTSKLYDFALCDTWSNTSLEPTATASSVSTNK